MSFNALEPKSMVPQGNGVAKIKVNRSDLGNANSLRYVVLTYIIEENYARSNQEIDRYINEKKDYQQFVFKAKRYVEYAKDLIRAIETKRRFPGFQSLSKSKRQEVNEIVTEHFNELIQYLKKIEAIELETRLDDIRSTVWVVKSICYSIGIIVLVSFMFEFFGGLFSTINYVIQDLFGVLSENVLSLFGF